MTRREEKGTPKKEVKEKPLTPKKEGGGDIGSAGDPKK